MELRRPNHLHYISAIKCGQVVKSLNVTRGKPNLSFKDIKWILDHEELSHDSKPKAIPLAVRSLDKDFGVNMVNSEEDIINDSYIGTHVELSGGSNKRSHDLDDNFLGEMTLKQLKKRCKSRKRSAQRSVDKEVKKEFADSHLEKDDLDLEETLGSLKSKISRKPKSRKMQKCVSGPKITDVIKREPISFDEDSLQVRGSIDMCARNNAEISELDGSLCQEVTCSSGELYSSEHQGGISLVKVISEMQETGEGCLKEEDSLTIMEGSKVCNADPVTCENIHHKIATSLPLEIPDSDEMMKVDDGCSLKEGSSLIAEVHLEGSCLPPESSNHEEAKAVDHSVIATSLPLEIPDLGQMMKVDDLATIGRVTSELPDSDDGCSSKEHSSSTAADRQVCKVNQISYEHIEHFEGSCLSTESSNYEEATVIEDLTMAPDQPMVMPLLARVEDEDITDTLTCKESPDFVFPMRHLSACNDNGVAYPHENKSPYQETKSPDDQSICMGTSHMQSVGSSSQGEACLSMQCNKEDELPDFKGMPVNSHNNGLDEASRYAKPLNQVNEVVPDNYSKPVTEEVNPSMDDSHPCDDTDKVSWPFASESIGCFDLQHPPERLLSARKTISPTSQQKLWRAMKSLDLPDEVQTKKCKQRLCLEKQETNANASSDVSRSQALMTCGRPENINTVDTSLKSEQKRKNGKEDKKVVRIKGDNKVAHPQTPHRLSSSCTFTQSCSENVITFSQQQMHDIERLAAKLTNELRSMKEIMIETLHPETRRATTSRYNLNEVRIAVENANKAEETAKRWLAIMTRDCNRFCKIMNLTERSDASVASRADKEEAENDGTCIVNEGRKKITFADENGARLCDVRFIEDQDSLLLDSPTGREKSQAA